MLSSTYVPVGETEFVFIKRYSLIKNTKKTLNDLYDLGERTERVLDAVTSGNRALSVHIVNKARLLRAWVDQEDIIDNGKVIYKVIETVVTLEALLTTAMALITDSNLQKQVKSDDYIRP